MTDVLQTVIGPAPVRHRLALAIECRDALSDRPTGTPVKVSWRRLPVQRKKEPVWRPLSRVGKSQFVLLHRIPDDPQRPLPQLEVVVDDPSRYYVPRRFTVTPWTYAEVKEPAPYVRAHARLLRLWLLPGSGYAFPRTATVIRGRVVQAGEPVRWARIEGTTMTSVAGWAHSDERGEFVLQVIKPGYDPVRVDQLTFDVELKVFAVKSLVMPDRLNRTADLTSEVIPRSSNPPLDSDLEAELDNDVLRGTAVPPEYVGNRAPVRKVTVRIGAAVNLTEDVVFEPKP
jgi:hypothetical protein